MSRTLYAFDAAWVAERRPPLAGADEAGRGAWAGPLVAAAVILGETEIYGVNDSKLLTSKRREVLFGEVLNRARATSVALLPVWWIDKFGVGAANREALIRAVSLLQPMSGCCLADGNLTLGAKIDSLPRADANSASVAAASVVAKVLRDRAMRGLASVYPGYGLHKNVGYGTLEHRIALKELGPCRAHRLTYAGVES